MGTLTRVFEKFCKTVLRDAESAEIRMLEAAYFYGANVTLEYLLECMGKMKTADELAVVMSALIAECEQARMNAVTFASANRGAVH